MRTYKPRGFVKGPPVRAKEFFERKNSRFTVENNPSGGEAPDGEPWPFRSPHPPRLKRTEAKKFPNSFKNFGKKSGETGGARTRDHKLKRLVLYRLSYRPTIFEARKCALVLRYSTRPAQAKTLALPPLRDIPAPRANSICSVCGPVRFSRHFGSGSTGNDSLFACIQLQLAHHDLNETQTIRVGGCSGSAGRVRRP